MQDDEGFDNNQKLELIDFNYCPLSIHQDHKRNILAQQKSKQSWEQLDRYLPSRDDLRQQCSQQIITKQKQNIVFNNFNHSIGLQEHQISFEANFQSSNLQIAIKRKYLEYQLYMRPDTNTNSYFQWFYFRVKCLKAKKNVVFTIKNFVKSTMLYTQGLKPFYKSSKDQDGKYIQLQTQVKYSENIDEYFDLKFSYLFEHDGEVIQLCSQPPYTYNHMIQKIGCLNGEQLNLCKSQLGKKVPYLIFNEQKQTKAVVIAIARQHPGETVGSWIMEGFLQKIQQDIYQSILWIVVPMINVDGVIIGNNRTGIAGLDYNRFWNFEEIQKKQKYLPQLISFFGILKSIRRKYPRKIKMFIDFHGHSSQPNVFSYGPPHQLQSQNFCKSRIFPQLLAKKNANFSLQQSSYTIKQDKKNTARSMLYNYFNVPFSYTIQGSFGLMRGVNVGVEQFITIGKDIAVTTNEFLCNYVLKQKCNELASILNQIRDKYKGNEGEQYDSDSEIIPKKKAEQSKISSYLQTKSQMKPYTISKTKTRIATDVSVSYNNKDAEENINLYKIQQTIPQRRYAKVHNSKRNQTEIAISKANKMTFFPRLKQTLTFRKQIPLKESCERQSLQGSIATLPQKGNFLNIKQLQKRLFRLRNSRIGKKILIINAYGI